MGIRRISPEAVPVGGAATSPEETTPAAADLATARSIARLSGLPLVEAIDTDRIEVETIRAFPHHLARERGLLPLYNDELGELLVGLADLSSIDKLDDLRVLYGRSIRPIIVPENVLADATQVAYDKAAQSASAIIDQAEDAVEGEADLDLEDAELLDDPNQAPIIRFVNAVLSQAIKERASDIHIEPYEKDLVVRFRVDGVLKESLRPPSRFKTTIVARIKIMAGLNIAEKRLPQDGRIRRKLGGREIDLRVSTVPVRHGERVVMRILEKGKVFSLDKIGMLGNTLNRFRELIYQPHGIMLVTGPTGSGKSTTLYSAITEINSPDKNILTIEDPVEYEASGVGQVQVNHKIDLTFASALRAFLRQDPDVILVGEIRDSETANNAIQASLTGHLVFSTLHTNDSATAFARLMDMDVEPFLVADTMLGVIAQRLVRTLCKSCAAPYRPSDLELREVGCTAEQIAQVPNATIFKAVGCEECNGVGYSGRTGIYEFLENSDEIQRMVIRNASSAEIAKVAREQGMFTLFEDGVRKVFQGTTTFDEVKRVTAADA